MQWHHLHSVSLMAPQYLQLWHAANQLVGHLHLRTGGIVEGHQLRGQVLVAIEEPVVGREKPGNLGAKRDKRLIPLLAGLRSLPPQGRVLCPWEPQASV